jgi:photosystem II stability/assembly factor-like uncharacterized protein
MRRLLHVLALLLCAWSIASAQTDRWQPSTGPYGAWVRDVVALADGSLLAATRSGLYHSTDDGSSWRYHSAYVIEKVERTGSGALVGFDGVALLRSTDDGATWVTTLADRPSFNDIVVADNGRIYAGGFAGFWRSTDDGRSWVQRGANRVVLKIVDVSSDTVIAFERDSVWTSHTRGETWTMSALSLIPFDAARAGDGTIFLTGRRRDEYKVLRSTDRGATWIAADGISVWPSSFAVTDDGALYAMGGGGAMRWNPAALRWIPLVTGNFGLLDAVVVSPRDSLLFAANADGVLRSTDDGVHWTWTVDGMVHAAALTVAVAPNGDIYASAGWHAFRSSDDGATWMRMATASRGAAVAVAPNGTVIASDYGGIARSTDDGATWSSRFIHSTVEIYLLRVADDGTMYASGSGSMAQFARSTDDGVTWTNPSPTLSSGYRPTMLALLEGGELLAGLVDGQILRSSDRGTSWLPVTQFPNMQAMAAATLPDGSTLIGFGDGPLRRMHSDGTSEAFGPQRFSRVSDLLVVGDSIYISADGVHLWRYAVDTDWQPLTEGLATTFVNDIAIHPRGFLLAALGGASVQRTEGVSEVGEERRLSRTTLNIAPQPASDRVELTFALKVPGEVTIAIRDLRGELVRVVAGVEFGRGEHRMALSTDALASGVYLVELRVGRERISRTMRVVR